MMIPAALVAGLLAATPASGPIKIMVMDVAANGVSDQTAAAITDLVSVELSRTKQLDVASGDDVRKLLQLEAEQQTVGECTDETSCLMAVAGALGAELIVYGKASKLGALTVVTLHLYDVAGARSLSRVSFSSKQDEALPEHVAIASTELVQALASRGVTVAKPGKHPAGTSAAAPTGAAKQGSASLGDLEALAKRRSYKELLDRALDVPASARDATWTKLVAEAATDRLKKAHNKSAFEALAVDESLADLYPLATAEPDYKAVQSVVADEGIAACFAKADVARRTVWRDRVQIPDCARLAEAYVARASPPPSQTLKLAKLVRRNSHASRAAGLFLAAIPKPGMSSCRELDVPLAAVAALQAKPGTELAEQGRTLAFERCYDASQKALKKGFVRGSHPNYFLNACGPMIKRKAIGRLMTKRCKRKLKGK